MTRAPPVRTLTGVRFSDSMEFVRIDKWLWAMRLYKTRSDAAQACRGGAVRINGNTAKPSAKLHRRDRVAARTQSLTRTVEVLELTEKRVGASRVPEFLEDHTPAAEFAYAREKRENARRSQGRDGGRPTKKDRRDIENLIGPGS